MFVFLAYINSLEFTFIYVILEFLNSKLWDIFIYFNMFEYCDSDHETTNKSKGKKI